MNYKKIILTKMGPLSKCLENMLNKKVELHVKCFDELFKTPLTRDRG